MSQSVSSNEVIPSPPFEENREGTGEQSPYLKPVGFPWKFWLLQLVPISMFLLSQPTKSMLTWGLYSVPQWVLGATDFSAFLDGTQLFSISCFSSQMTVLAAWLVLGKRWPYFRLSAIAGICLLHWCPDKWLSGARFIQTLYFPIIPQLFLLGTAYGLGFRLYRGPESENAFYHRQWRTRDLLLVLLVIPLMMANCAYWYGQLVKPISLSSEGLLPPAYWLAGIVDGEILGQKSAVAVIYNYHLAFYSAMLMGVALLVGRRPWLFPVVVMIVNLLLAFTWLIPNSEHILNSLVTLIAWQLAALCSHCLLLPPMGLTWGQPQTAQDHLLKNQPLVV